MLVELHGRTYASGKCKGEQVCASVPAEFFEAGAHYLYVNWSDVLMINAGKDSNIAVIQLKSLINP